MRAVLALGPIVTALLPGIAAGDTMAATTRAKSGDFDSRSEVGCAQEAEQSLGTCTAAVARAEDAAVVVVTFPNGFSRVLMFAGGDFLRGNATMSGVGTDTDWSASGGAYRIRVDDQRFEIPAALVWGE
jgi:hypothetical protein